MLDDQRYRAVQAKDGRFDGLFYTAVRTTGIFCRPSCPALTPRRENVTFFSTPAAAVGAGFRACRRCRPDRTPGSPEWNVRGDLVARAMRLIGDGVVEREGVPGLARRLGYSERQLHRSLTAEVGAGPLAIARSNRAQLARTLIETTDLPLADIAFAAGFGSIRQFNDTIRRVYAVSPRELRRGPRGATNRLTLRLPVRQPFDGGGLLAFLRPRAIAGVEIVGEDTYTRVMTLPHGPAVARLTLAGDHVRAELELTDLADTQAAVQRCRRLLDLDADPLAIDAALAADPILAPLVAARPGVRLPGQVDGFEVAVRAIVGQQVSVAGARTILGRIAARFGADVSLPMAEELGLRRTFPRPEDLAEAPDDEFSMPRSRAAAFLRVAQAMAAGGLTLDPGTDRDEARHRLLAVTGIGPWTADYIVLRALSDPDVLMPTDLVLRRELAARGITTEHTDRWRPWRSYAAVHLWRAATEERND
ncbi:DNA-3-methyladenine glycosylase 2 family protein [Aeromicrobium phragmitis]|uniref:DNA-3-methyladenine glycosylase II n=1 Tax=Aeromicrobium phragmitis TaxID=2478914 RepID=A0A3L8PN06_9ACTN|nr:AlkA N-terminal domain-containing protein [Aeromicrobium phragmitis]RLV56634.1 DNA-3-methyladenine glycosylase 2 family protein [Aeromicrobium phragmitis]